MQDAFPWVENYWDSGERGLHVHMRACVYLDPGVLEVPASVFPLPAQTWVPRHPGSPFSGHQGRGWEWGFPTPILSYPGNRGLHRMKEVAGVTGTTL